MSNFKRVLSLVLVCAMLMSSVACLGGVFTIGAAAADATYGLYNGGKILTKSEIETKFASQINKTASDYFGWAYYTGDILEVPVGEESKADEIVYAEGDDLATYLTDGYVDAGQMLIVRNYIACSDSIYMYAPTVGYSMDNTLFEATTLEDGTLAASDTIASKGECINLNHPLYLEHKAAWVNNLNKGISNWNTNAYKIKTGLSVDRMKSYTLCQFGIEYDGWFQTDGQDWIAAHAIYVKAGLADGTTGSIWVDRGTNKAVNGTTEEGSWFKDFKSNAPWNISARTVAAIEGGNKGDPVTDDYMHKTGITVITSDFGGDFIIGEPKAATHAVTFYADAEATTALTTTTDYSAIEEGATFTAPAETPEAPVGTTFGGWASSADSTTPASWPQTMGTADMAFYPIFSAKTSYSITYYKDEAGTEVFTSVSAFEGDTYTISAEGPSKTGYSFSGWTATQGGTDLVSGEITATANAFYYPVFTKNSYTVTFDANGGEFAADAVTTKSIPYDDAITADGISAPTKLGAEFLGWAKDSTATEPDADFGTVPANNRTNLYAVWAVAEYEIAVYNEKGDAAPVVTLTVKYNETCPSFDSALLTAPEGEDGDAATTIFAGWNYVADDSATGGSILRPLGTGKYTNTEDTAIYATWTDSASLKFMIPDYSDNEGWVDVYTHIKLRNGGTTAAFDETTFAKALEAANAKAAENGLSFTDSINWYSDEALTTIAANQKGQTPEKEFYTYATDGAVSVTYLYIGASYKATVALYANEGDETPFITKEGQAGDNSDERMRTFVVSKTALPEAPVGQHFVGWFDKDGNELVPTAETANAYTYAYTPGDFAYYAKFEDIIFTVEFKVDGNVIGTAEVAYGDTINFNDVAAASDGTIPAIGDNLDEIYKPGYILKGWSAAYINTLLTDELVIDNTVRIVANAIESGTHTITFYANANGGNFEARKFVATLVCPEGAAFADGETTKTLEVAVGTTRDNITRAVEAAYGLPVKEGHTFSFWTYDTTIGGTTGDMPAQDFTYTASFSANTVKVTFDPNNGSDPMPINKSYGDSAAETIAAFNHPYYRWPAGSVFEGWVLTEGTLGADGDSLTGDVTYTADYATFGEKYFFIVYNSGCETNDTADEATYNEYIYKTISKDGFKTQYWEKGEYVDSKEEAELLKIESNVIIFFKLKLMGFDFSRFFEVEMWQNLYFTVVPVDVAKSMFTVQGMIDTIKLIITALGAL